jgi:hypothetical protein
LFGFRKRLGAERTDLPAARLSPADESSIFKHLYVLGGPGEADVERLAELTDGPFTKCEVRKHPAPRGIRESLENRVEPGRITFNHMV